MLYGNISTSDKKKNSIKADLSTTQTIDLIRHKKMTMFIIIISLFHLSIFPKPLLSYVTIAYLTKI